LNFGGKCVVSRPGAVSTPAISGDTDSYYFLTLEGISVEGKRIESSRNFSHNIYKWQHYHWFENHINISARGSFKFMRLKPIDHLI